MKKVPIATSVIQALQSIGDILAADEWIITGLLACLGQDVRIGSVETDREGANMAVDRRRVFVVYGRNGSLRAALFAFLRSIGLEPLEWSHCLEHTSKASPYIGEILDAAFARTQAVVVLMTPDDEGRPRKQFQELDDDRSDRVLTPQPRLNVVFEASMAMGRSPDRTILVQLGRPMRPFSDIGGRHVVRLNNSVASRQGLAQRLRTAGCSVDITGTDWLTEGDLYAAVR